MNRSTALLLLVAAAAPACTSSTPAEPPRPTPTTTAPTPVDAADAGPWWSAPVAAAVGRAGANGAEITSALTSVPPEQRDGMAFLIEHMPPGDLTTLDAEFLLENVRLAYDARAAAPWGDALPDDVFLNDVLPYAHVSETRERWRADFRERFLPVVAECKTPGEAAQKLNMTVFEALGVSYSTKRKKPDQSPSESAEIGMASCTGLSIILADACRSVGVPARLAGTPSWVKKRGNHTWVEVWDGDWHFTGAAEPSAKGLNHAWFERDAAHATSDPPEHGIYAVSYRRTGQVFPMVWARDADPVSGVDVTGRYARAQAAAPATLTLSVVVLASPDGARLAASVRVVDTEDESVVFTGTSRGPKADMNDVLSFVVPAGRTWAVSAEVGGKRVSGGQVSASGNAKVRLVLGE